jgi:Na+-translocating ferredoxin:NAD+ oxidoreductase RnfG subunit
MSEKLDFKNVAKPTGVLVGICLAVAAALVVTNYFTADIIAQNDIAAQNEARKKVLFAQDYRDLPYTAEKGVVICEAWGSEDDLAAALNAGSNVSGSDLSPSDLTSPDGAEGADNAADGADTSDGGTDISSPDSGAEDGTLPLSGSDVSGSDIDTPEKLVLAGYVVTSSASGYGGDVRVITGINTEGRVTGVTILEMSETPGIGVKAGRPEWLAQFIQKTAEKGVSFTDEGEGRVDAITGATISSTAVLTAVNKAMRAYRISVGLEIDPNAPPAPPEPVSHSDISPSDLSGSDISPSDTVPSRKSNTQVVETIGAATEENGGER